MYNVYSSDVLRQLIFIKLCYSTEKQNQENKKQVDREQRVMKTKEGKQREEKTEKSRETDCCNVSGQQKKKKEGKEIWITEKKNQKNTLKCRWCTCVRQKPENYIFLKVILLYIFSPTWWYAPLFPSTLEDSLVD